MNANAKLRPISRERAKKSLTTAMTPLAPNDLARDFPTPWRQLWLDGLEDFPDIVVWQLELIAIAVNPILAAHDLCTTTVGACDLIDQSLAEEMSWVEYVDRFTDALLRAKQF